MSHDRNFFGKGSVVVPSDGEGEVRRVAICPDRFVTQPFEGVEVIPDVVARAAQVHGTKEAMGWRNIVTIHEEEKEVKKVVGGQEVTEKKNWKYFELSDYQFITFVEAAERIQELARGLLHHGIHKDDVFNIYAQTSANWQLMSYACTTIATPVATAYDTLGEAGLTHSLNEPNCVGVFTNADLLPTLSRVIKQTPSVRLVVYDGEPKQSLLDEIRGATDGVAVVSIDQLRQVGKTQSVEALQNRKPTPDDVALIMYTSGTTGAPKGVVLTHRNVLAALGGIFHLLGHHLRDDDTFLAYLPLAHILEFVVEMTMFAGGVKSGYGRVKTLTDASVRKCKGDIAALRPTIMIGVPTVWETIRKGIIAKVNASGALKKNLFHGAFALKKAKVPILSHVADAVVFSGVRAATGGRLRLALSGGAALSKETQEFLSVALVTVLQGYGMTESCAMCAILPPELMQYGSVGLPVPSVEIKLLDVPEAGYKSSNNPPQGEVCIRGPAVTKGYYKRPDLNDDEKIFTKDGWLRTGDVGQWNADGTLSLIDRIKNLVKLQSGEYIALEQLESVYKSCNLVANLCVYASAEAKQPIAIIIPHELNLRHALEGAKLNGVDSTAPLADLCANKAVQQLILKETNAVGKKNGFKHMETLEAVILTADEWMPESGLVTAAQKVQRTKVAKHFEREIKDIYRNQ